MAQVPQPRSQSQILADITDAFLSKLGLRQLKIGSPLLCAFESAAQSDLRSSDDIFTLLASISLDQAAGVALDRIGADEGVPRELAGPSTGTVTVTDASFTKISSVVFQGTAAPIVGSTVVNVPDASHFPVIGSIYLGRGTSAYEGPIAYTAILPPGVGGGMSGGSYYSLVLATGTLRFHNQGESVILAQGGLRQVPSGTVVQTPQGNVSSAVQFTTRYLAQVQDGEVQVTGVPVLASLPGITGNVGAGAIGGFGGALPFAGATVSNSTPLTNGTADETDDSYRERIRDARASRARGTPLAIETFSVGVTSPDENKRVISASVVTRTGGGTTCYVDDGTGYEEVSQGVAIEVLYDSALGGETYFKVAQPRPVTKACVVSALSAPFVLAAGMQWAFSVGGVTTVHSISADEFAAIGNATGYEWVASVNADANLNWMARTVNQGANVVAFAKADANEAILYEPGAVTNDGNEATGFGSTRVETISLYKNDRLLSKDGAPAIVTSAPFSSWGALGGAGTEDLELQVDGTPMANLAGGTYTFAGADFVNAATGYTSVGRNSVAAWAAVINYRVPGVKASVVNGLLAITSNRGLSSGASLAILGGSLVSKGVFAATVTPIVGADSDYVFDRNTGEGRLAAPLVAGDRLSAGSASTRAFLQSPPLGTFAVASGAHLWFAVDGGAAIVPTGLTGSTAVNFTVTSKSWGKRERVAQATGTGMFSNVLVGDWAVFWDPASPADLLGRALRVAAVDVAAGTWFEVDRSAASGSGPTSLTAAGLAIVRTSAQLQLATLGAGSTYTATGAATALASLVGASAEVYQTTALRVNTNTHALGTGDLMLAAADADGLRFGLPVGQLVRNSVGQQASVQSSASELGTPDFHQAWVTSASGIASQPTVDWNADPVYAGPSVAGWLAGLRPMPDDMTLTGTRYGTDTGFASTMTAATSTGGNDYALTLRSLPYETFLSGRWYFAGPLRLASDDQLAVLVDGNVDTERFTIPMWRRLGTVGTVYASNNAFVDADNGSQSLTIGFGSGSSGFAFEDFAVMMPARLQTHLQGDATHYSSPPADLTRTVLWRYYRLGADGNLARVRYALPSAPSSAVAVVVDNVTNLTTDISIQLASGALKTGYPLTATQKIGVIVTTSSAGVSSVAYLLGLPSSTAQRTSNVTTITVNVGAVGATNHNFQNGDQLYVKNGNATYPDGTYTITTVSATQFSYADVGSNAGPTAITGDVSYGTAEATLTGASPAVVTGDVLWIGPTTGLGANFVGRPMRIDSLPNAQAMVGVLPETLSVNTVVTWASVLDASAVQIFANAGQTAAVITAAVNALSGGANSTCPIAGTVIGSGAGVIDKASYAEASSATAQWFNLADGVNHVAVTTVPGSPSGNYQLSFKSPITAALATNSDWAHETVKVVPRTATNLVAWLSAPAVSGLFTSAEVLRSSDGRHVQISSLTPGSAGSVLVQGGTADSATASVLGSATAAGTGMLITVPQANGIPAGAWCSINNAEVLPRAVFTSATVLQSVAASGPVDFLLTISGTTFYSTRASAVTSAVLAIEAQGNFWAITDTGFGAALAVGSLGEGDYVRLEAPASPIYAGNVSYPACALLGQANAGIFRVIRVVSSPNVGGVTIWVENPAGVAQPLAEATLQLLTPDSILPGDILKISTPLWDGAGGSNQGTYQVVDVGHGGGGSYTSPTSLTVLGPMNIVSSPAAALGSSAPQVQVVEGLPARLIKQLVGVAPNQTSGSLVDLKLSTSALVGKVGAAAGSVLTVLDKLGFGQAVASGADGYQHSVGLIAAVNLTLYGDLEDSSAYPGVVAAGADVSVQGPSVRRVQVTIAIRLRSGASAPDVVAAVQSAVAGVINAAGVGEAIALSDLTAAAGRVGGVVSAVMVSPAASAGADLINVQPFEKPMILNLDQDVLVTLVGA